MRKFSREEIQGRVEGVSNVLHAIVSCAEELFATPNTAFDKAYEVYYDAQRQVRKGEAHFESAEINRLSAITSANTTLVEETEKFLNDQGSLINGTKERAQAKVKEARGLLAEENQKEVGKLCREAFNMVQSAIEQAKKEAERAIKMKTNIEERLFEFNQRTMNVSADKREPLNQLALTVMMGLEFWPQNYDLTVDLMTAAEVYYEKVKRYFNSNVFSGSTRRSVEITETVDGGETSGEAVEKDSKEVAATATAG